MGIVCSLKKRSKRGDGATQARMNKMRFAPSTVFVCRHHTLRAPLEFLYVNALLERLCIAHCAERGWCVRVSGEEQGEALCLITLQAGWVFTVSDSLGDLSH